MSTPKKKCSDTCPLVAEDGAIVKKHSTRDILGLVLLAFLGGNTSGGLILGGGAGKETSQALGRIERKVGEMERKISTFRVELQDLKIEIKLRDKK